MKNGAKNSEREKKLLAVAMSRGMNADIPTQGTAQEHFLVGPGRVKALEKKIHGRNAGDFAGTDAGARK